MSDNEKSGTPNAASADLPAHAPAPADSSGAIPMVAPKGETQPIGGFGSTRGSGLARGKRPTPAAQAAAPATPAGYKPTALEVITPQSEYRNPFTGETTVRAPIVNEPAPQAAPIVPAPAAAIQPASVEDAPKVTTAPAAFEPGPAPAVRKPDLTEAPAAKSELKILPPEAPKRPALHWETPSGGTGTPPAPQPQQRRDDRPTFRTERDRRDNKPFEARESKPFEPREPRSFEGRDPREPRRDDRKFEPRTNQPYRERSAPVPEEPVKKSGGFVGWLKGLFGAKAPAPSSAPAPGGEPRRDGDQGYRRHGGGRGRGQGGGFRDENRGPRPDRQPGGDPRQQGEPRGEDNYGGGQRRRRRRGGRGRYRGEGGDRGGPSPEGQQGGGAI